MLEQSSVILGLSVILAQSPSWEMIPSGCVLTSFGMLTLAGVGYSVPTGDTGPSRPEPPPAETAVLCSALGTETACFRVFPEDTVVATASYSTVTPRRAPRPGGDWSPICWPLFYIIASTRISPL